MRYAGKKVKVKYTPEKDYGNCIKHKWGKIEHHLGEYPFCTKLQRCIKCHFIKIIDFSIAPKCHRDNCYSLNHIHKSKGGEKINE